MMTDPPRNQRSTDDSCSNFSASGNHYERTLDVVKDSMGLAISLNKTESLDVVLDDFSQGYFSLSNENRKKLVIVLAKEYDLNRIQVRELLKQYLGLELRSGNEGELSNVDDENMFSAFYRIERNLRQALKPTYNVLFERLNNYTGGLKFLSLLRADILSFLGEENIASLRALDSCLKEKLSTWLSPAVLELHQITWDDSASLLEKIVTYECIQSAIVILDLKRRLGVGRRCFGYFHPSNTRKSVPQSIGANYLASIQIECKGSFAGVPSHYLQHEAGLALFYSISSTQFAFVIGKEEVTLISLSFSGTWNAMV
ncbi:hypothetical protein D5086_007744 [Populus alba]|uniref:Uncharacterized protein n=1 Tax=Populus alba TaxID=43335 RepID=A0ACC4CEP0_POPAL